jgi:hypothetical protein
LTAPSTVFTAAIPAAITAAFAAFFATLFTLALFFAAAFFFDPPGLEACFVFVRDFADARRADALAFDRRFAGFFMSSS